MRQILALSVLLAIAAPVAWAAPADEDLGASLGRTVSSWSGDAVRCAATPCRPSAPAVHPCYVNQRRWHFAIAPYAWLAAVDGTAYADGEGTDFEVPFEKLLERTNGGLQLYAEARYNRFYLAFDGTWANLGDSLDLSPLGILTRTLDIEVEQQILDFRAGYRIWRKMLSSAPGRAGAKPCRTLDVYLYAGLRYFRTELTVDLSLPILGPRRITDTSEYLDPLFGARVTMDLGRRFALAFHGDAAALFSDDDIMSWVAQLTFSYSFTPHIAIAVGYRVMGLDQTTGTGIERSGAKMVNHGPMFGLGFAF